MTLRDPRSLLPSATCALPIAAQNTRLSPPFSCGNEMHPPFRASPNTDRLMTTTPRYPAERPPLAQDPADPVALVPRSPALPQPETMAVSPQLRYLLCPLARAQPPVDAQQAKRHHCSGRAQ